MKATEAGVAAATTEVTSAVTAEETTAAGTLTTPERTEVAVDDFPSWGVSPIAWEGVPCCGEEEGNDGDLDAAAPRPCVAGGLTSPLAPPSLAAARPRAGPD